MHNLFRAPSQTLTVDLEAAMRAILAVTPLSRVHEQELPYAVRDLSRLLTQDRSQLAYSYWINKRLLTAYCRYFLPWNLLRLSWMLPGSGLTLAANDTVLDLGSGPLTMPIALWLAFPGWRELPLTIVCSDVAPVPLNMGREIFRHLASDSPWTIELRRGPLDQVLNGFSGTASLITAANVLNELKPSRETPMHSRLEILTRRIVARLAPGGRFLAMEPGTRLGGRLMALLRQAGFSSRLVPEAPCPHWKACPMLERNATGWCHFSHIAGSVPASLAALTKRAGLGKENLSLSCMTLRHASDEEIAHAEAFLPALPEEEDFSDGFTDDGWIDEVDNGEEGGFAPWPEAFAAVSPSLVENRGIIRILSDPIRLPGLDEPARYACSEKGLVLAHNALRLPSGAAVAVRWPEREHRDPKSGALVVVLPSSRTGKPTIAEEVLKGKKVPEKTRKIGQLPVQNADKTTRRESVPVMPGSPKRRAKPDAGTPNGYKRKVSKSPIDKKER